MPAKKKVKKKAKKKSVKKEPVEGEEKPLFDFPEYEDPNIFTPKATLVIILASPIVTKFTFKTEVMITTRV